jgi:fluoride exporter
MSSGQTNKLYSTPDVYRSLTELVAPAPVQDPQAGTSCSQTSRQGLPSTDEVEHPATDFLHHINRPYEENYEVPGDYIGLNELTAPSPVDNPHEEPLSRHEFLENAQSRDQTYECNEERKRSAQYPRRADENGSSSSGTQASFSWHERASEFATVLYTVSYLIIFSILGTLARLGLQALTIYPNNPVAFSVLWANVGGTFIMGYLGEDTRLFKGSHWGGNSEAENENRDDDAENAVVGGVVSRNDLPDPTNPGAEEEIAKKAHIATKKAIPLYIGLTTGFCGSFTSFSSFIRDSFLALSNELPGVSSNSGSEVTISSRNGGYSLMALIAVVFLTVCLCLSSLKAGAHLAIALEKLTPSFPVTFTRKILDRIAVLVACGMWLGSIFMAIWPPDRPSGPAGQQNTSWTQESWRNQVLFALVFAPIGCVLRFYASLQLNSKLAAFPLGTFVVNISGTAILGMCWDLQHAPLGSTGANIGGGRLGCQVLQGIQDGFCGCLTTVSTWVLELTG